MVEAARMAEPNEVTLGAGQNGFRSKRGCADVIIAARRAIGEGREVEEKGPRLRLFDIKKSALQCG